MFAIHTAFLGLLVALVGTAQAAASAAKPLETLCRDYREYTERRPMVDRLRTPFRASAAAPGRQVAVGF